jgi:hypothetical protein
MVEPTVVVAIAAALASVGAAIELNVTLASVALGVGTTGTKSLPPQADSSALLAAIVVRGNIGAAPNMRSTRRRDIISGVWLIFLAPWLVEVRPSNCVRRYPGEINGRVCRLDDKNVSRAECGWRRDEFRGMRSLIRIKAARQARRIVFLHRDEFTHAKDGSTVILPAYRPRSR